MYIYWITKIIKGEYLLQQAMVDEIIDEYAPKTVTNKTDRYMENKQPDVGIVLPTEIRKATATNPESICLYGKPKVGKTTILSELPNNLIIDTEKGTAFIDGLVIQPPEGMGPVGIRMWLKDVAKKIIEAGRPYDYVSIDTLSQLDVYSEWWGTWDYMHSIAGKKFNKKLDPSGNVMYGEDKKPILLKPDDPEYESVLTLGNGYGYQHTRTAFMDMFNLLKGLGKKCTIFVCHVSDKMIGEKNGEQVMVKDLALTGKLRDMLPRIVDAVGNVWNEDGQMMISFKGSEDKMGGVRGKHLPGYAGKLDWSFIFKEEDSTDTKKK